KFTACAGRSPHRFSRETTKKYEEAREKTSKFINANDPAEIVWTRNTTEALNIGSGVLKLDGTETIICTSDSHNSNIVKWMFLENNNKAKLKVLKTGMDGLCDKKCLIEAIEDCDEGKFLVTLAHVSNVSAAIINVKEIAKIVHEREGIFQLDAAQSFPHQPIDVKEMGIDLMGVSMHKACGPTGMGFLYGRYEILEKLNPLILGGETVSDVMIPNVIKLLPPPAKFEAGLQNYAGTIASGATIDYLNSLGIENIQSYEHKLSEALITGLKNFGDRVSVIGPKDSKERAALAAINLKETNPHEVAILMDDMYNIALRSGYHCTHAYHHNLDLDQGTLRPSWYLYNTIDEIKIFLEALEELLDTLG
ncbi:MAG: aminotransferase class V-fold PLP-dependent enzyme, partial [Candidatus Hodarchaeota archaeon]